ncbi:MAG TPA: LysM peptidoglycan-binding domain-containing protein [Desulfobacteraceae bacterium]|nr:LysM peptidoglycan-binding domain-containing protein [Desulfobacteraceae bacterium]
MKSHSSVSKRIYSISCAIFIILTFSWSSLAQENEQTYSIDLVKTPETEKQIHLFDNKKILSEVYTVQKGEWIVKVLRKKGLLEQYKIHELLAMFKKLNKSMENLDMIYPGEKIIVPIKIVPIGIKSENKSVSLKEENLNPSKLKGINFDNYTVKPGDELIKIINGRYKMPQKHIYNEYLNLVKQLNPSIKNPDKIYVGQKIRLPVYSPEIVRKPVIPSGLSEKAVSQKPKQEPNPLANDLAMIFLEIGEEWIQTGKHFIPLKSGGQIDLNAVSFPIINLKSGRRVIVDLYDKLPEKMAGLIESNWENYRIVHLHKEDNLRSALNKILTECNYPKLYKKDESYESEGPIHIKIMGDYIIVRKKDGTEDKADIIAINLINSEALYTPETIKNYLKGLNISIIEYPPQKVTRTADAIKAETIEGGRNPEALLKNVLKLIGQPFSTQVEIPVSQGSRMDFKLIINADFLLKNRKNDTIIDITGLAPEVIQFLKESQFLVLSLADKKNPLFFVEETFKFLDIQFHGGPHNFMAATGGKSGNIQLTLPGIVFSDSQGKTIFATSLHLPVEITSFLSQRGFSILDLSSFSSKDSK